MLVFACTILGSAAQLLIKTGMSHFSPHVLALVTNLPLIAGYTLYGINTLMMVLALRNGEMSLLVPDHRADLCVDHPAELYPPR